MDKGAHFHRCDLQVHTPRDRQWDGTVPSNEDERKLFATSMILGCRQKGLDAIAITDHHDFAYFEYVKMAAESELDDDGQPVPKENQITVFPGMELTLAVPCQALLILDADFPPTLLPTIYTALAIAATDHALPQCPQTQPLSNFTLLSQLHDRLDEHSHLKGRYILLPHVSDGGHKTLLRSNFQAKYTEMPCVGGYLDGSAEKMGNGVRKITDGLDRSYGFKKIGVFQTSDNRRADFADLGKHSTWIKWAKPTAEALRQACLARDTRISHTEPQLPPLWIRSLEVNQSRFMGPISLDLNRQLNCLIGGRGTGKSTILEYLRWALCDQPPGWTDKDELPDFQSKRAALIANTLVPLDATVTVTVEVNGVLHTVRRRSQDGQITLKIDDGEPEVRTEDDVRGLLPLQAYSQKQLSAVGVRTDELVRFIRSPIKRQLDEVKDKEQRLRADIRKHYGNVRAKRDLLRQIEKEEFELESLAKQEKALRGQLKGLDDNDQAVLAIHDAYVKEGGIVAAWQKDIVQVREAIDRAQFAISSLPAKPANIDDLPNETLISDLNGKLIAFINAVRSRLSELASSVAPGTAILAAVEEGVTKLTKASSEHNQKYEAAKQKASSQQALLTQIQKVEERSKAVRASVAEKRSQLANLGDPDALYTKSRSEWMELYRERGTLLENKCLELTDLSKQRIRARLKRGGGIDQARIKLESLISGTRIRNKKIEDLCESVAKASDSVSGWEQALRELESLANLPKEEEGDVSLPDTPVWSAADFSRSDLEKLARKITPNEWLDISLVELTDVPIFEYEQREGEYIPFAAASAGQQATALLRVLLNQDGPPLIIDQPEEDLDNQVVLEIVKDIWRAKQRRQVIVTSHNANIVVNGDADLVVCCDYRRAGDQSGGRIKSEGAIDIDEIRQEITTVMEGGKDAFRLRKEKYGF